MSHLVLSSVEYDSESELVSVLLPDVRLSKGSPSRVAKLLFNVKACKVAVKLLFPEASDCCFEVSSMYSCLPSSVNLSCNLGLLDVAGVEVAINPTE